MVKIRLKRMGTTKRPFYRLVVADAHSPRDGRFIEALGYYDPLPQPAAVRIDAERVREWLRRGARPSDSARDLLVAQGILAGDPRRAARVAAASELAAAAEAGVEAATEAEMAAPAAAGAREPGAADAEAEGEAPAAEVEPGATTAVSAIAEAPGARERAEADAEVAGHEKAADEAEPASDELAPAVEGPGASEEDG